MHRSGTSVAARALQLLGVSLGDTGALMPPGPDNKAGYYENRSIKELNDEVLAQLGGAWDQPPVLDPGWEDDAGLDPFRERAASILEHAFGPAAMRPAIIGWKDPRLALLLPFWRTVCPIDTTIVLVRDPEEVASSLHVRNRIDAPQAAVLWLRYLFAAAANDRGHLLIGHRAFFDDLSKTLETVARHLDLRAPAPEVEASVRDHLDVSLHHHVAAPADPPRAGANPLVALAATVWNGGRVDLRAVPDVVADAIARGWFRPPIDAELLTRARAQVVELRELVRRRSREAQAQKEAAARAAAEHAEQGEQAHPAAPAEQAVTEATGKPGTGAGDESRSGCHG
jgi:hypothetical protein